MTKSGTFACAVKQEKNLRNGHLTFEVSLSHMVLSGPPKTEVPLGDSWDALSWFLTQAANLGVHVVIANGEPSLRIGASE